MRTRRRWSGVVASLVGLGIIALVAAPSAAFEGSAVLGEGSGYAPPHALRLSVGSADRDGYRLNFTAAPRLPLRFTAKTERERRKWIAPTVAVFALALITPDDDGLETLFFAATLAGIVLYFDAPDPLAPPMPGSYEGLGLGFRDRAPNMGYQIRW